MNLFLLEIYLHYFNMFIKVILFFYLTIVASSMKPTDMYKDIDIIREAKPTDQYKQSAIIRGVLKSTN